MTQPMRAIHLGDQLHAEMTHKAEAAVRKQFRDEGILLTENEDLVMQVGVQAGMHMAMRTLVDMGLLRAEVPE